MYLGWLEDSVTRQFIVSAAQRWTIESLREFVAAMSAREDVLFFGIFTLDQSKHIGNIKFEHVDGARGSTELGVLIGDPEWRGKGVFPEIFVALQSALREQFSVRQIHLGVDKANVAAIKAYMRSGFEVSDGSYFHGRSSPDATYMVARS
jgi:RimJ/RimL family protein N-acetyltransferase